LLADLLWGALWGLSFAVIYVLILVVLFVLQGPALFRDYNTTFGVVAGIYFVGGEQVSSESPRRRFQALASTTDLLGACGGATGGPSTICITSGHDEIGSAHFAPAQ
jgi:uncharacterized membrane protein YccC